MTYVHGQDLSDCGKTGGDTQESILQRHQPRHGWAPDPPMVGIRSPIGLVVGSCTSHPGVLGSIPKREEPGKTGAPCVKVPGSSRVPRRGDVELRSYLQDAVGRRSLVFDLSMTHNRFGSSSHVQQNGLLSHPQDLDAPLRLAAQRKINSYRQQYADNQNTSFLPAIVSTSTRMHGEFLRLFFLQAHRDVHGRLSRTLLLLECHRKTTPRTRSVSSARHSISH